MKVMVVHSGHGFSTKDVGDGLVYGLRSQGVEVIEYPLMDTLESMELLIGAAKLVDISPPNGYPDIYQMATMGIPGQAMAKQVEAVIFVHGLNVPASIPVTLRRGGYTTALLCTETPYQIEQERNIAQFYDLVFTNDRACAGMFSLNHPDTVHYLPHAYRPDVHTVDGERAAPCDVFFVGTRFPERATLLDGVDWTGINLCERTIDYTKDKAEVLKQITPNAQAAAHYRSAFISLCHHRADPPGFAESLNPRCYEVPACGGFLISDYRAELHDIFGTSVPTYTDADSLSSLVRYFLAHPEERDALAARQREAIASHHWGERARDMLHILAQHRTTTEDIHLWAH